MGPCWRIWYDDGTYLEGCSDEQWKKLPQQGILIVKDFQSKPPIVHMGMDYYWLENKTVKSCSRRDLDRYLIRSQGLQNVKLGRWGDNPIWKAAHDMAMKT